MAWQGESGTRIVETFLVGAVTAIVALAFFLPIPLEWKIIGIVVLVVEGALLLLFQLGQGRAILWRIQGWSRERAIKKHPEFVVELYRMEKKLHATLYERSTSQPSLRLQGADAMANLSAADTTLSQEFQEKIDILNGSYTVVHQRIEQRSRSRRFGWKTMEFVDTVREISNHLTQVNHAFATAYRAAARFPKKQELPGDAWNLWEAFRLEYNVVLQEWKSFTQRFDETIRYGTGTNTEPVKALR